MSKKKKQEKESFDFEEQLKVGNKGETLFLKLYKHKAAKKADVFDYDFTIRCGKTVELKTDTYSMEDTKNFFIERWSDFKNKKPGGPYQSSADFFVYCYIKHQMFYWFRRQELLDSLDERKYGLVSIKNKGYTTMGYKVPRDHIKEICIAIDKFKDA